MDEQKRALYEEAGIDVADAMPRFMNNVAMFDMFMKKFLDDPNYGKLKDALDVGDTEEAFRAVHTLKGVCGNLSMKDLFKVVNEQTELLRAGKLEEAREVMPEVTREYDKVINGLKACF